ncbi:phenylalanyl-tRNA synthetase, putative [Actinidia rufa]|uniref:Phenylalanyl-tRNA synthetase, putative n=1 Tax=Actinidia rufa TaxID=165716 RepID=A0A7J0F929_9ERIC|nr:phenylalanyl-tRNA synthetase, putative [Actinidia rufa]
MAEEAVLGFLEKNEEITDSGQFAAERGIDHQEITNIIKSLYGFKPVDARDIKREKWVLTDEGRTYAAAGSPEVQLFSAIPPEGISLEELQRKLDPTVLKIGRFQVIKNQWVDMGKQIVTRKMKNNVSIEVFLPHRHHVYNSNISLISLLMLIICCRFKMWKTKLNTCFYGSKMERWLCQ